MKIVLTGAEKNAVQSFAELVGLKFNTVAPQVEIKQESDNTEVTINPEFVTDYVGFLYSVAPLIKSTFQHATSVFSIIEQLGNSLDAKWSKLCNKEVA